MTTYLKVSLQLRDFFYTVPNCGNYLESSFVLPCLAITNEAIVSTMKIEAIYQNPSELQNLTSTQCRYSYSY